LNNLCQENKLFDSRVTEEAEVAQRRHLDTTPYLKLFR